MDTDRLAQLADEAALGLSADREVFLEVRHELETHLEDTAARRLKEGHTPEESEDLAARAFGPAPEVAKALQKANFPRLRLRARLRILFAAVVVPVVLVLALYLGYGRFARLMVVLQDGFDITGSAFDPPHVFWVPKVPQVPGVFRSPQIPDLTDFIVQQNRPRDDNPVAVIDPTNPANLYSYWKAHQNEPGAERYYACWLVISGQSRTFSLQDEGERMDPNNALYDVIRANDLFRQSITSLENQVPGATQDEVLDRAVMDRAIATLKAAVRKPYLRAYEYPLLQEYLAVQPDPHLTEDYVWREENYSAILFPQLGRYRALARSIPGAVRILIKEGNRNEAEAVLDTWKPYARLLITDPDPTKRDNFIISDLVAEACTSILAKAATDLYPVLGRPEKAADAQSVLRLITVLRAEQNARRSKLEELGQTLQRSGPAIFSVPALVYLPSAKYDSYDLRPARMHEDVLMEEVALEVAMVLLTLALLANLLRGVLVWVSERRAGAHSLRLVPSAALLGRALLWGVVVPIVCYAVYSRLPVIGGREYGWGVMWPRFGAELALLIAVVMTVSGILLARGLRARWPILGVVTPPAGTVRWLASEVTLVVVAGVTGVFLFWLAMARGNDETNILSAGTYDFTPLNLWMAGIIAGVWLVVLILPLIVLRGPYLRFCGAASRAASVLLACVILTLGLLQPVLMWQEATWLSRDKVGLGAYGNKGAGYTSQVEADAEQYLHARLVEALDGK